MSEVRLETMRKRIARLRDTIAQHLVHGNEIAAAQAEQELRQLEIEAGYLAHALED